MVKHIAMFRFKDGVSAEERKEKAALIKERTEALLGVVPGVLELKVQIAPVGTSTHDLLLEAMFESQEALSQYQVHPDHLAIGQIFRQVCEGRACYDYEA